MYHFVSVFCCYSYQKLCKPMSYVSLGIKSNTFVIFVNKICECKYFMKTSIYYVHENLTITTEDVYESP